MKKNFILSLLTIILVNYLFSQDTYRLEYKLELGKTYRYKDVIKSKVTQEVMGQETRVDSKVEVMHKVFVDSIYENGIYSLVVSFDSVRANISTKQFDTTIVIHGIAHKKKDYEVNNLGRIIRKSTLDKIILGGQLSENVTQQNIEFHVFDDKEIKIGDKWATTTHDTLDVMGSKLLMSTNSKYKIAKKENKFDRECLKIEYESESESEGSINFQGQQLYFEVSSDAEGYFYYDIARKIMLYDKSETEATTTLATSGQGAMMIPIMQKISLERTIVE